jgi:hypothetical protein
LSCGGKHGDGDQGGGAGKHGDGDEGGETPSTATATRAAVPASNQGGGAGKQGNGDQGGKTASTTEMVATMRVRNSRVCCT